MNLILDRYSGSSVQELSSSGQIGGVLKRKFEPPEGWTVKNCKGIPKIEERDVASRVDPASFFPARSVLDSTLITRLIMSKQTVRN